MKAKEQITMGGIIKHSKGLGFKITFQNKETANKYKDMFRWILINDGHPLVYNHGYYDKYNKDGYEK
jgi:hypothetical protein